MKDEHSLNKAGPREVFLQLLSIITLYMSTSSLVSLLFSYIDLFRDPHYYPGNFAQTAMRFPMATLIVSFPVYFYTIKKYREWSKANPDLNSLRVKAWLSYFTLFLASIFIVCDLGSVVYRFLGGDFSLGFLTKTVILFTLCALIFYYYSRDLKQAWQGKSLIAFAAGIWALVLATIIYGLFFAGAPFKPQLSNTPSANTIPFGQTNIPFPTQTGNPNFQWKKKQSNTMPKNALIVNKLYICQGQVQANNYPGQYVNGSCRLTYGGHVFDVKQFVILTQQNNAGQWLPANTVSNSSPIYGGFEHGSSMAICKVNINGATQIGKVVNGNICNIAIANQEVSFNYYQVLYPVS